MGFLSGSLSIKRYFLEDIDYFVKNKVQVVTKVNDYIFTPIDDSASEEAVGWASPFKPYKPALEHEDIFLDSYLYFAMRIDTKSVSKAYVDYKALEKIEKENISIKSKTDLKNLKEDVRYQLIKRALPNPKLIEGVIDTNISTLFVNSSSKRSNGYFLSLFGKTFDVKPVYIDSTMFSHLSLKSSELINSLSNSEESIFCDY